MVKRYIVSLSSDEREKLKKMLAGGRNGVRKLTRARILLKADEGLNDQAISQALDIGISTIKRLRKRFVEEGLEALKHRPSRRNYTRKLDGQAEAHLIALACSQPPAGYASWSLRLLADKLVEVAQLELESISYETVRRVLKQNELKPWQKQQWVIPPKANAEFVYRMEEILDLYALSFDPDYPLVCFDESSKQLIAETRRPLPMSPGQVARFDYEYKRKGVRNLFLFFAPLAGWRHVKVTMRRTKKEWATCMKELVDCHFPQALAIRLVQDNLNTHNPAALYEFFQPAEAKRILDRLEFHFTPKHGSWLNMAETEFSVLMRQCLNRRIPDEDTLIQEVTAWQEARNRVTSTINWRFTTDDARIKLKRLYPKIDFV